MASASIHDVRLVLARRAYRVGQSVMVTVVNGSRSLILHNDCVVLQRQDGGGWVTVTSTHGIAVRAPGWRRSATRRR